MVPDAAITSALNYNTKIYEARKQGQLAGRGQRQHEHQYCRVFVTNVVGPSGQSCLSSILVLALCITGGMFTNMGYKFKYAFRLTTYRFAANKANHR